MTEVTAWDVTKWRSARVKKGLKAGTVNRDVNALKAMFSKAVEWGVLATNPLASVRPLRVDDAATARYLTEEEEKRLRNALVQRQEAQRQERERYNAWRTQRHQQPYEDISRKELTDHLLPLILLALNTGLRRGEMFNLKVGDVNLKERFLTVQGSGSKSGKTRHIPLNDEAFSTLVTWINQEGLRRGDYLFISPITGRRFNNINKSWRGLIQEAKIKHFRFHDIRHTFASKLVMRGVDLYTVKELLGHSSIEMTQRYAHLAPEHKAKAVELLDERR